MNAGDLIAGRFKLDHRIGAGGLGVVWAAIDMQMGRKVAIKLLKSPSGDAIRRFESEAKALARLSHPGCVSLIHFGRTDGNIPFLVMEHVPGQTLAAATGTRHQISEVLDILEQLLRVLNYAHSRRIAHRDLKPSNIIRTPQNRLMVLDFGLAKITGLDSADLTRTGEVFGSPIYMSPEQLRGSRDAGPPSDIYALGVMAYELLTGRPPYPGESMVELAMGHLGQIPPEIDRPDCPIELKQLVADMLAKDAADRPTAAQALAVVNPEATQEAGPIEVRAPRDPRVIIASLIVAAIAMSAFAWFVVGGDEDTTEPAGGKPPITKSNAPSERNEPVARAERSTHSAVGASTVCRSHAAGVYQLSPSLGTSWTFYVPEKNDGRPRAVIVVFPFDRMTPKQMLEDSGLIKQADIHGFLLLTPESTAELELDALRNQTLDAVDELSAKSCIDRERLYAIGHGTGGHAASAVGCMPEFAALVTASYNPTSGQPFFGCPSPPPRPVLHLAPRKSKHAPYKGGERCDSGGLAMSVPDYTSSWRERNECSKGSRKRSYEDGICTAWTDCAAPVVVCEIDGGNDWPGVHSTDPRPECAGPTSSFPSSEVAVDFLLKQRQRPKGCRGDFVPDPGRTYTAEVNGAQRHLWMAVPKDYDPSRPYPTILVVGYSHREPDQYARTRADFDEIALRGGYILIAPMPVTHHAPWTAPGDDEFLRDAVDIASDSLCIDRSRVFGISHSDGATRLRKLACEKPFAGLALTGVAELDPPEECEPLGPPPTIRVVGRDDDYVPILGGLGCDQRVKYLDADESDARWTEELGFGCRGRKSPWEPRPDACHTWDLCQTTYVSCRVDGGQFFKDTRLAEFGHAMYHAKCPTESKPFDLKFEKTILPFFDKHGQPIP